MESTVSCGFHRRHDAFMAFASYWLFPVWPYERSSIPIVQGKETSNNTAGSMTERPSIPYHFSRTARFSKSLIYDIGTEILMFHCFATKMLKSFCESIIFSGVETARRDLTFYSIKTWFKALWDIFFENLHATLDSQLIKYFAQKAPAGIFSEPFYKIFLKKGPCGHIKGALLQHIKGALLQNI